MKTTSYIITLSIYFVFSFVCFFNTLAISASPIILYNANQGTVPESQGWLYLQEPLFQCLAIEKKTEDGLRIDTTPRIEEKAGYYSTMHPLLPILDRKRGFEITLSLRVIYEQHERPHRAGFSLIVITRDLRGIEICFWENEVWAQADSPMFSHAEGAAYDTTQLTNYSLLIFEDAYILTANGQPILKGQLRNYSAFGIPYNLHSFIFFGDETSSASSEAHIQRLEITTPIMYANSAPKS